MMGGYYGYGNLTGGAWLGVLMMFLFGALCIAGIVLLIVWFMRSSGGSAPLAGPPGHDEAIAIAKRRFASGEITKDQYDDIMRALAG
jgi:uncharacterized membrane protein